MKVVKSPEGEWMLDIGTMLVAFSCHHKKKGACGGCYARLVRFTKDMAAAGNEDAAALLAEMKRKA